MINEVDLKEFINSNWNELCDTAYRSYLDLGRGLIGLKLLINESKQREAQFVYGIFKDTSQMDPKVIAMIESYTPEEEFLLQFQTEKGTVKTMCVVADKKLKTPKEVWLMMSKTRENMDKAD
jgi:hypothetical protein